MNNHIYKFLLIFIIAIVYCLMTYLCLTNKVSTKCAIITCVILSLIVFVYITIYLFNYNSINDSLYCTTCDTKVHDDHKDNHGQCKMIYVCDNKEEFTPNMKSNTSSPAIKKHSYNVPNRTLPRTSTSPKTHTNIYNKKPINKNTNIIKNSGAMKTEIKYTKGNSNKKNMTEHSQELADHRQELAEHRQELAEHRQEQNLKRMEEMNEEHHNIQEESYNQHEKFQENEEHQMEQESEQEYDNDDIDINRPDAIAEKDFWRTRYGTHNNYDTDFGGMFYDENPFYNRYNNENDDDYVETMEDIEDKRRRQLRENARIRRMKADLYDKEYTIDGYTTPYQKVGIKSEKHRIGRNRRAIDGPLDDELPYSDYNHLPVASGYKSRASEYGYSFLPPEKWYPQPPRPPVCVTEKRCPVCPVTADGTPTDVKEFHESRRVTQPDSINTAYINDKLNAGR
jgi:hypothetical protein